MSMHHILGRLEGTHGPAGAAATRAEDLVTTVLSAWLVVALFSDGWAHHNVPELEGFFTPWHLALYAGFLAIAAWMLRVAWSRAPRRSPGLPTTYRWGVAGVAVFAAGGVADMMWHLTFGVEEGIEALVSPSHLVLLTGGLLITTSALRSRWAAADTGSFVTHAALALATSLAAFFLLYVSEFTAAAPTVPFDRLPEGSPQHVAAELPATAGLGGFLITTAVLLVPLLALWKRADVLPRGSATVVVGAVSLLSASVVGLGSVELAGAVGATAGALVADAVLAPLGRRLGGSALRLPAMAAVTAGLVWSGHLAALALSGGLAWPPELWSGVVVLSVLAAGALGALATTARAQAAPVAGSSVGGAGEGARASSVRTGG